MEAYMRAITSTITDMVPALAIIPMVKYMKGNGIKTRELAEQK